MNYLLNIMQNLNENDIVIIILLLTFLIIIVILLTYIKLLKHKQLSQEQINIKKENLEDNNIKESIIEENNIEENNKEQENKSVTKELTELGMEIKELEELAKVETIKMTPYEEEQEEKAIISYDELLQKSSNVSIGYSNFTNEDDIIVKQVDLNNTGKIELDPIQKEINSKVRIINYEHEEDFLKALKQLNNMLN